MRKKIIIAVILVVLVFISGFVIWQAAFRKGPASSQEELHYIPVPLNDPGKETSMILGGQANLIRKIGSISEIENLQGKQDIQVIKSGKSGFTINCIFFNLRRNPGSEPAFRAAIARIVNRDYLAGSILNDLVSPCSYFVPPISKAWTNEDAAAPPFDPVQAANMLDAAGYVFDKDAKTRKDPVTHEPLYLTILTPLQNYDPVSWDIGYLVTYYINGLGIKADHIALPDILYKERAMQSRDFDILVQEISLAQSPFGLYPLLHSSRDQKGSNAFPGVRDPVLDAELETLWSDPDPTAARQAALSIQTWLAGNLPYVAVCSTPAYSAVRGQWDGIVNLPGYGIDNLWTYQAIRPSGQNPGGALTLTAPGGFDSLNPLLANSEAEWSVLQQIFSPLLYSDPQDMTDKPILASSWDTEAWKAPDGRQGMKVTFHLVDKVTWQDGVPFTSQDVKFCIDFLRSHPVSRFENIVSRIDHVEAQNDLTVEIYLNDSGCRYVYQLAWFTFMPQHIWRDVTDYQAFRPWEEENPQDRSLTGLVGQGPYILKKGDLKNGVQLYRYSKAYVVKP